MATSPHDNDKDPLDQKQGSKAPDANAKKALRSAGPRRFGAVAWAGLAASLAVIALTVILHNRSGTSPGADAGPPGRLENAKIEVLADPEAAAANIGAELKRLGINVYLGHNDGNPTISANIPPEKNKAVNAVINPYTVPPDNRLAFEFRKTASGK